MEEPVGRSCTSCGKIHGMVIENTITGECEPIDLCYDCIFKDCFSKTITEQVSLKEAFSETMQNLPV